jgi:hypothetical protein
MRVTIILAIVVIVVMGCDKEKTDPAPKKTAAELLTQKEWILTGAGFDDNKNGILDDAENTILDCQKDNSFVFYNNGTGSSLDNTLFCGSPVNTDFTWQFLENAAKLVIQTEQLFILQLDEEKLVLNPDLPGLSVKFMMQYKH